MLDIAVIANLIWSLKILRQKVEGFGGNVTKAGCYSFSFIVCLKSLDSRFVGMGKWLALYALGFVVYSYV
jgi:hypothetical protein